MDFVVDQNRTDLGGNLHHGDIASWSPALWDFFIKRFALRSVLDVGCGEGHAAHFFYKQGIIAHGIDGLKLNVLRAVYPIAQHDILAGPYVMPVDLVWSCEVAEHIAAEKVDNYLDTLCNGTYIAMTHGLPGQMGHNHVNLQHPDYWIAKMHGRGYRLDRANELYRKIASQDGAFNFFAKTGLVFSRV